MGAMTTTSVARLIEASTAATNTDAGWAASDAHLDMLGQYLRGRAPSITDVQWHQKSFWDRKSGIVFLERPSVGGSLLEDVIRCALNASMNHPMRATQQIRWRPRFVELDKLDTAGNEIAVLLRDIFNQLEDERVMRSEAKAETDDVAEMDEFREKVIADHVAEYRTTHNEELWSASPASPSAQFTTALAMLIHGGVLQELHSRVTTLLKDCAPAINHAADGGMMNAIASTYTIVTLYGAALPELV
jgi:hypothetical protein